MAILPSLTFVTSLRRPSRRMTFRGWRAFCLMTSGSASAAASARRLSPSDGRAPPAIGISSGRNWPRQCTSAVRRRSTAVARNYRAMPAMFVTGDDFDGFSTWVALPGAIVRSRPNAGAPVRRRLGAWTVLEEVEHDGGDWIELPRHAVTSRRHRLAACSITASSSAAATASGASRRSSRAIDPAAAIAA